MTQHSEPRGASPGLHSFEAPPGWEVLFTERGAVYLAAVTSGLERGEQLVTLASRLRAEGLAPEEAAAIMTQAGLRMKAQSKLGDTASRMLFTQAGLEQASRGQIAELHASRFAAAGCREVADLGCGIGTESLALEAAGVRAHPVEIDPFTARIAQHNLRAEAERRGTPVPQVVVDDATNADLTRIDGAFLDPARRTAGHRETKRLTRPEDYSPSLDFAFGLAARMPTGVKLGPGFERELIPDTAEAQWVSIDGQLVEMGLWFGALARPGITRAALVLRTGAKPSSHELVAAEDAPDAPERPLGEYIYEPDGSVIRARLIGLLAEQLGAGMLSEDIAYLTTDTLTPTPFAQGFRVLEELPASEKALRRALAERDIGTLEIKKRGTDVDPATLRTRLRLRGARSATLILCRIAGAHSALLAERV